MDTSLTCKFCSKQCKNPNSHRNHERLCNENPDRQFTCFSSKNPNKQVTRDWKRSNGAIKAKELGVPFVTSEKQRLALSRSMKSRSKEWHAENGKKIAETVRQKVLNGEWHSSISKKRQVEYRGIRFDSSWEVAYAKYLDSNGIEWDRCKDSFQYQYGNKDRMYTPDFYLVKSGSYVEIKGLQRDRDIAKWNQFPKDKTLIVLKEKELKELGIV